MGAGLILWASLIAYAVLKPSTGGLVILVGTLAILAGVILRLFHKRIKFYEEGVEIPPDRYALVPLWDSPGPRYLRWDQIASSTWDGDRLLLTGAGSMPAEGPVQGGAVPIPSAQRQAVDQVLSARMPVR